jgi:hypothetical protein
VGREEGVSSIRPELAALARTLQATSTGTDLLYVPMRQQDDLNQGVQVDRQRPADDTCR